MPFLLSCVPFWNYCERRADKLFIKVKVRVQGVSGAWLELTSLWLPHHCFCNSGMIDNGGSCCSSRSQDFIFFCHQACKSCWLVQATLRRWHQLTTLMWSVYHLVIPFCSCLLALLCILSDCFVLLGDYWNTRSLALILITSCGAT